MAHDAVTPANYSRRVQNEGPDWRARLPAERDRAAEQYLAGGLPDGEDTVRVWQPREVAVLRTRLGQATLAAWSEQDVLHVLWRGDADEVQLGAGLQPQLWPVQGTTDLWEASQRIRGLDESVITIVVVASQGGRIASGTVPDQLVWRGPRAPAGLPAAGELTGTLDEHSLDAPALGAPRRLTVYRPPGPAGPLPGCVLADGQATHGFALVLEPAIQAGAVPPVLLVGVHNATDPSQERPARWPDRRAQEYVPRYGRRWFGPHLDFVIDAVIPWVTGEFDVTPDTWTAAGFSNGAVWAINAAQRRPDVFATVAALSAGLVPRRISRAARAAPVRHYLASGRLEPGFRTATREWADRLQRAGLPCQHQEWPGGHDPYWWDQHFPAALAWLLAPPGS